MIPAGGADPWRPAGTRFREPERLRRLPHPPSFRQPGAPRHHAVVVGSAAAVADATLYVAQGDYVSAAMSMTAVIPGAAIISEGTRALKAIRDVDEAVTVVSDVEKADKALQAIDEVETVANDAGRVEKAASDAEKAETAATDAEKTDQAASDASKVESCATHSFAPDTTVATASGSVAISSLKVGDQVLAYDPKTGETASHPVDAVMVNLDPVVEHLVTSAGSIETTPNHPFFTADRAWVEAGNLLPGEHLRTDSGTDAVVVSFTTEATPEAMWDLTVDTAHSFFVGSGAVLVHNCAKRDPMWSSDAPDSANRFRPLANTVDTLRSAASATGQALGSMNRLPLWVKIPVLTGMTSVVGSTIFGLPQGYPGPGEPRPTPHIYPTAQPSVRPYIEPWRPGFWWQRPE